jgi:arginyl-tRNA synthetase
MGAPYSELRRCVAEVVSRAFTRVGVEVSATSVEGVIQEPPRPEFGDFAVPLPRISKDLVERCRDARSAIGETSNECVERAECVGSYLNIWLKNNYLAEVLGRALASSRVNYGITKKGTSERVIVEFVSANPVHPLHIGSGRNAVLGDFIARAHELLGDLVERRYYVNDLGLQVAYLLYGYIKLSRPETPPTMKEDHFLGLIYAATSTLADIVRLRKKLEQLGGTEAEAARRELDALVGDLLRIRGRAPDVVDALTKSLSTVEDVDQEVRALALALESCDPLVAEVHREVVNKVLNGIRQTLERLGVMFDKWDYESELVRSGLVGEVMERARSSEYFTYYKNAPALDLGRFASDPVRDELGIPRSLEVPPLILARSDGTTLYTTRDIAYTIKKFREFSADKVYNVIAIEQTLPQAQLRLALYALGFHKEAKSLTHYAYEIVNVKGFAMSGRRARYVTVDEIIDTLIARARELAKSRGTEISDETALKIARSAFRYIMLSVSPRKTLLFDPEQAVEVKSGTATYVQYTYARASNILSRYGKDPDFSNIGGEGLVGKRRELALLIAKFPEVFRRVALELTPEDMISYLNKLSEVFNSWYDIDPVLSEPNERLRNLKLLLVYGTKIVIENSFKLLGLDAIERI